MARGSNRGRAIPMPASEKESVSLSVRKISNGYILRTERTDGKGNWQSHETYTQDRPVLPTAPQPAPKVVRPKRQG